MRCVRGCVREWVRARVRTGCTGGWVGAYTVPTVLSCRPPVLLRSFVLCFARIPLVSVRWARTHAPTHAPRPPRTHSRTNGPMHAPPHPRTHSRTNGPMHAPPHPRTHSRTNGPMHAPPTHPHTDTGSQRGSKAGCTRDRATRMGRDASPRIQPQALCTCGQGPGPL